MDTNFKEIIEDYLKDTPFSLVELIVRGEKKHKVLEIYIDEKENMPIEGLTKVNRDLNELFDEKGISDELSKIVVSSPGAEKPFKFIWQLYKHKDRILSIILGSDEELEGKLMDVNEDGTIEVMPVVKGKSKKAAAETANRTINFDEIKECKVKLKF